MRQTQFNAALADTTLARGLYHRPIGQPGAPESAWQKAASFPDAPVWVIRSAGNPSERQP